MLFESPIAVLGAGSWGTALALHLARNGNVVRLWGHSPELMQQLQQTRINEPYFPGIVLPETIEVFADMQQCLLDVRDVLIMVPSVGFHDCLMRIKSCANVALLRFAWGTKGLDPKTGALLNQVLQQEMGHEAVGAVLSGPSFAKEVVRGLPTAVSLAGNDDKFLDDLIQRFHSNSFRVYKNPDMLGVELCGCDEKCISGCDWDCRWDGVWGQYARGNDHAWFSRDESVMSEHGG